MDAESHEEVSALAAQVGSESSVRKVVKLVADIYNVAPEAEEEDKAEGLPNKTSTLLQK